MRTHPDEGAVTVCTVEPVDGGKWGKGGRGHSSQLGVAATRGVASITASASGSVQLLHLQDHQSNSLRLLVASLNYRRLGA